jgi:hypothetical protein
VKRPDRSGLDGETERIYKYTIKAAIKMDDRAKNSHLTRSSLIKPCQSESRPHEKRLVNLENGGHE